MATWPTSVPTDANLYIAVNELQTNLSAGINAAVATIGLNSTTSFPTVGLVLIDNEIIQYTGVSGGNLTGCTRGFDGTTAATHSAAAVVSFAICANHHNVLKDEIKAICTYLSNNLGTGAAPLTASRALVSDGAGKIIVATVTSAELAFLSGVTSAIQTQINTKAPSASPTFTGTITTPLAVSKAVVTDGSNALAASATSAAEIGFVAGLTSAVQTQIDSKGTFTTWAAYTPTVVDGGTPTNISFFWRQEGDSVHIRGTFKTGTVGGSTASITMPAGKTIATSKIPTGTANTALAGFWCSAGGVLFGSGDAFGAVFSDGSTTGTLFFARTGVAGSGLTKGTGSGIWASTVFILIDVTIPI